MKRIIPLLILLIIVPGSAQAFGAYSNDQLNTTNTTQNISFETVFSETVYITIPRNINVTTAIWNFTGFGIIDPVPNSTSSIVSSSTGPMASTGNAVDGDFLTSSGCNCADHVNNCTCSLFMNYTFTKETTGFEIVERIGYDDTEGMRLYMFNFTANDWDIYINITTGSAVETLTNIFGSDYVNVTEAHQWVNMSRTGFSDFDRYFEANTSFILFPQNVTVDSALNGENDFVNGTIFFTNETINLNVTAINNYLRNTALCTGDFTTATCDVPFNVSSIDIGILRLSNISILGELIFGIYNITIFDEMTGLSFDVAGTNSTIITAFCGNETQNLTITAQGQTFNVLCQLDEMKITIIEDASTILRYRVPVSNFENIDFYMYNSTEETDVEQEWIIYDITGDYAQGIIEVTKVIGSFGEKIMIEKVIDAEGKVTLFLVVGERYCVSAFTSIKTNERSIGCIDADSDALKRMSISNIPFTPDQNLIFRDVFIGFNWDADTAIIQGIYNDTLGETTSVAFTVYNASNISQVVFTDTSTSSVVTFTFNNVDINSSYIAEITAVHQRYGTIDPQQPISFQGLFRVVGIEGLGLGIFMSIAAGLIVSFVVLAFGRIHGTMGLAVGMFMLMLFMFWGWFAQSPQMSWSIITLLAFVVFANVIAFRRKKQ